MRIFLLSYSFSQLVGYLLFPPLPPTSFASFFPSCLPSCWLCPPLPLVSLCLPVSSCIFLVSLPCLPSSYFSCISNVVHVYLHIYVSRYASMKCQLLSIYVYMCVENCLAFQANMRKLVSVRMPRRQICLNQFWLFTVWGLRKYNFVACLLKIE